MSKFTSYQLGLAILLSLVQFAVTLDFMILAPLGVFVMKNLNISPSQFSMVVAAYAISSFVSALFSASFADRFDRKRLLIIFYVGFIIGTLFCAISNSFTTLLLARALTGVFGGVMSSISMAIITDSFEPEKRGKASGLFQMGFGLSQVLGIPLGLWLTSMVNWQFPFYVIVGFAIIMLVGITLVLKPMPKKDTLSKFSFAETYFSLFKNSRYTNAFLATCVMITGGFMIMPFASDFAVHNLKMQEKNLYLIYLVTGACTFVFSMLSGILSDKIGKYKIFAFGTLLSLCVVLIYTRMGETTTWLILLLNGILFTGIATRIVPSQAMMTLVPIAEERGRFMSMNSAIQSLSGGIATLISGLIVYKDKNEVLHNYEVVGYVVAFTMILTLLQMGRLNKILKT